MKKLFIIFLILNVFYIFSVDNPVDPDEPIVNDEEKTNVQNNIKIKYQNGYENEGVIKGIKGNYLNLTWKNNESADQEILMDFVKSITIKGYSIIKKNRDNLSIIYYFPHIFDIQLKNGKSIKNATGRIKAIESFTLYNDIGRQKCYSYFVRYWLEDKGMFNDNKSTNYNETPKVPGSVVTYFEFLE